MNLTIHTNYEQMESLMEDLEPQLKKDFLFEAFILYNDIQLPKECLNKERRQFNGKCILDNFLKENKDNNIDLIIINEDAFVERLNFVFGIARRNQGALVSLYRLEEDHDFILKEIIHELGHVLGLEHCKIPCVMTFSNSVTEARQKSTEFCENCQEKLQKKI